MLKTILMLFRNAVMWTVLSLWLFKGIAGAGNIFAVYAVGVALLTVVSICIPVKPEDALKASLAGKFWRCIELISQWAILAVLVWFGHFGVAMAWAAACVGLMIMRIRILEAKKKAQKEWMERDAAVIMSAFSAMSQ